MRRLVYILPVLLSLLLMACDRAPDGVIGERKMARLLADLQLADAYVDQHSQEYPDDSSKLVLKQSIYRKYGVTQADYDSSLVWYAHHMDVYAKVYERMVNNLKERQEDLKGIPGDRATDRAADRPMTRVGSSLSSHDYYAATGDTSDVWTLPRTYMLTPGRRTGFIPFSFVPQQNQKRGDRLELTFRLVKNQSEFSALLAVDYVDGTTAYMNRPFANDGWNTITLQSDSLRQVRRVYGYIGYNIKRQEVAWVDSVMLVRMPHSPTNYHYITVQRTLERTAGVVPVTANPALPPRRDSLAPKDDLNKSSQRLPIDRSPNAARLPKKVMR